MINRTKTWIKTLFAAALLIAALYIGVPWKSWAQAQLQAFLTNHGFHNVQLTVASIGLHGLALKDISFGEKNPLHIEQLDFGLSPALLRGHVQEINLSGLTLDMKKEGARWTISGLDAGAPSQTNNKPIPVSADFPFDSLKLANSRLHAASGLWQMDIPLQGAWQRRPTPGLTYEASGLSLKAQDINVVTGDVVLKAVLNESNKKWNGEWHINDIKITGIGPDTPLLSGKGTVTAEEDKLMVQGQFASADQTYKSSFQLDYVFGEPAKSKLEVVETSLPWNGGTISAAKVLVPLVEQSGVSINLNVQRVSLASLLQQLTGREAAATGAISGSLPVTVAADGNITVQTGKLQAEEPGVISMPPESIPGDNEQVALARDVLKNLHYTLLSIDVDQDKDKKLSVLMKVEGSNPDVYQGKPVKLNVHLTGDVLNFIQQNLMILTNPEQLLQQGQDAKH